MISFSLLCQLQYYAEVLGYQPSSLYQARFGLFLQGELHHSFDRGHVALYPLVSDALDGSCVLSTIFSTLTTLVTSTR